MLVTEANRITSRMSFCSVPYQRLVRESCISDLSVTEGHTGSASATFTVTLSAASRQQVTVNYATANGTATTAGGDYSAALGTLTFASGVLTQSITISVVDTTVEPNETFFVNLSGPVNATIAGAQGQGTILNDDPP
jgi:hypothetical protein